jgi:hypothetical protein
VFIDADLGLVCVFWSDKIEEKVGVNFKTSKGLIKLFIFEVKFDDKVANCGVHDGVSSVCFGGGSNLLFRLS